MKNVNRSWPLSSIILTAAGFSLFATGLYFILLRPVLLTEDIRYMKLSTAEAEVVGTQIGAWLTQVFRVMGGYIVASGALTIALATTSFREHRSGAAVGVLIGGASSIGCMTAINFTIGSDFRWVLFGMTLLWICSLGLFWWEERHMNPKKSTLLG
jgi:hypothetical protein